MFDFFSSPPDISQELKDMLASDSPDFNAVIKNDSCIRGVDTRNKDLLE